MAVRTKTAKVLESCFVVIVHFGNVNCMVMNLYARLAKLSINLTRIDVAILAKQFSVLTTKLSFFGIGKTSGPLSSKVMHQTTITLCPHPIFASRR